MTWVLSSAGDCRMGVQAHKYHHENCEHVKSVESFPFHFRPPPRNSGLPAAV